MGIKKFTKKESDRIIRKFTEAVLKKHGTVIRAIILFGSAARGDENNNSDIDLVPIVDDTENNHNPNYIEKLEEEIHSTRQIFLSHTVLKEQYILRMAIGNMHTRWHHIERAWEIINSSLDRIMAR